MRRVPPRPTDLADTDRRLTSVSRPRRRLQRLQLALLLVLALWFIDSGFDSSSQLTPPVSSAGSHAVTVVEEPGIEFGAVREILEDVNPNLHASEVSRITAAVFRYSEKYGLDPELVTAVLLVESSARPWVRSSKGAVGLMQVMPHMMEPLGLAGNAATIESNIEAGCWILANNIRRLGEARGISSYFWGSDIRGLAYLEKVQSARAEVRRYRPS